MLLRRIRDVMASSDAAQARLDRLVKVIADGFGCEVCSIYLMRAGDVLELYASQGLKAASVHATRLHTGEGLVGEIAMSAAALNLAESASHPKYVYRPETGEEIYHSFLGVPILHSNKVMGVLVVQSKSAKIFSEDQVEILQTVAMVVAELTMSGQLVSLIELRQGSSASLLSQHLAGTRISPGVARAKAVIHHPRIEIKKIVADDIALEERRLQDALQKLQRSVEELIQSHNLSEGDEQYEIMETYRLFTHDKGWIRQLTEAIESGLTAEAAVKKVQDQLHARMSQVSSEYIKERMQDLEDLSTRLLQHLAGEFTPFKEDLPPKFILVARSIGPAELLEYGRKRLRGLVLEEGTATSHIAIITRAMDIPVVGKVPGITGLVHPGERIIVDGNNGEVYLRPTEDIDRAIVEYIRQDRRRSAAYAAKRDLPAVTKDGVSVSLNLNIGLFVDEKHLGAADVDGIGLYRTELPFMVTADFPDVEAQTKDYAKVLATAGGKRVIFRTLDVGGDKQLPYFHIDPEENPAMGWRATRMVLDRPAILRQQVRALLHAATGKELNVMFPFIAEVPELLAARKILDKEIVRAREEGFEMPKHIRVGAMIEIPSILYQLPELFRNVNFISIGSNDLLQFLFAWDRGSPHLNDRYDTLSPTVLKIIRTIVNLARETEVDVGFCGDMASKPLEAMALIGAGVRNLSMPTASIGPVKAMLRSLSVEHLAGYMDYLLTLSDHSLRSKLMSYAQDHGVTLE